MPKLAKQFSFVLSDEHNDDTLFTALRLEDGKYKVSWISDDCGVFTGINFDSTIYGESTVEAAIKDGAWIVRSVDVPADAEVLKLSSYGCDFDLFKEDGLWALKWDDGRTVYAYTQELVDQFIQQGYWQYQEAQKAAPAPQTVVVEEFWPDFSEVVGLSVQALKEFCEATGYAVEVDEDFYEFKLDGVSEFVVSNEDQAVEVMAALRTLVKYQDRG